MVETAHVQWKKIAKIGEKQCRAAKISTTYRKSMSVNPFSVRNLRPEVKINALTAHAQTLSCLKQAALDRHRVHLNVFILY